MINPDIKVCPAILHFFLIINQAGRMTEAQMIKGVADKDRDAVKCLVESYQKRIIKTAYYFLGNMEDAEDLAQEAFLEIVSSMHRFRGRSSLSTWIYRITVNRSLNALKKRKRQAFLSMDSIKGMPEQIADPLEGAEMNEQLQLEEEMIHKVRSSVHSLKGKQKAAFILHKYEGLSYKQIADVMNTSLSSVESLMHRAKMNVQKSLARQFSEHKKN
jgi:RNA polymerase sigma-70 factor (ECF subfamily)